MKIKRILVPLDFSECSINALRIAIKIAQKHSSHLELMNTVNIHNMPNRVLVSSVVAEYQTVIQSDQFENVIQEIPELSQVHYAIKKMQGTPKNAIYTCLEKDKIDLVIMGTKEEHDPLEKLVGTLSADVIEFSNVPVIVIPESIKNMNMRRVGFATDLQKITDINQLDLLIELVKIANAKLEVFHIYRDADILDLEENTREGMKLLNGLVDTKHTYVLVNEEDVLDGILKFVDDSKLDLLVMYPRHHGFWDKIQHGSITKKMIHQSRTPLMTIHE